MDAHTLTTLEFDLVRRKLADEAFTDPGRRSALALQPLADADAVRWLQDETMEMRRATAEEGRPPVDGMTDLSKVLTAVRIEGHPLEPQELLAIAASLRAARSVLTWAGRIAWEHPKIDVIVGTVTAPAVTRGAADREAGGADPAADGGRDRGIADVAVPEVQRVMPSRISCSLSSSTSNSLRASCSISSAAAPRLTASARA